MSFRYPYLLLWLSLLLFLSSCSSPTLLAGSYNSWVNRYTSPENNPLRYWGYLDAQGDKARFDNIVAIALDSHENVYVADQGNARIRKIDQQGVVTTLVGSDQKQTVFTDQDKPLATQLINLAGLSIYNDVLYFSVSDCIRTLDLKEQAPSVHTFYGKCLEEAVAGERPPVKPDPVPPLVIDKALDEPDPARRFLKEPGELAHDAYGNLYVHAITDQPREDKTDTGYENVYFSYFHKIGRQKVVTALVQSSPSDAYISVDSKGCPSFLTERGWDRMFDDPNKKIQSNCRKRPQESGFFYGSLESEDPRLDPEKIFALWMGKNDDLYIFGQWLATLSIEGELNFITPLEGLKGNLVTLNADESVLYNAGTTAVYRWPIPGKMKNQ